MKVTPSFASLNGADEPRLTVTIKLDGPVLTYSSLETEPEHKAALNSKKKVQSTAGGTETAGVPGYAVTVLALPILRGEVYSSGIC